MAIIKYFLCFIRHFWRHILPGLSLPMLPKLAKINPHTYSLQIAVGYYVFLQEELNVLLFQLYKVVILTPQADFFTAIEKFILQLN